MYSRFIVKLECLHDLVNEFHYNILKLNWLSKNLKLHLTLPCSTSHIKTNFISIVCKTTSLLVLKSDFNTYHKVKELRKRFNASHFKKTFVNILLSSLLTTAFLLSELREWVLIQLKIVIILTYLLGLQ